MLGWLRVLRFESCLVGLNVAYGFCAVQLEVEFVGSVRVRNATDLHIGCIPFSVNIITARNEVWGKVMFLHLSFSHSVHSDHRSGRYASYWNAYLFLIFSIFYYSCSQYLYITVKGVLTPSDSVTVTVMFDGQNGYVTHSAHHSAHQRSKVTE